MKIILVLLLTIRRYYDVARSRVFDGMTFAPLVIPCRKMYGLSQVKLISVFYIPIMGLAPYRQNQQ